MASAPAAPAPPRAIDLPIYPVNKNSGVASGIPGAAAAAEAVKKSLTNPGNKPSERGGRKTRRRRLMSRKYCKKTSCRRMGFTQKASCRPYKNCYK